MEQARIPAHIEVAGLIRQVQAEGGFATVLASGEREAGTLLVILCCNGRDYSAFERMPQADGSRQWACAKRRESSDILAFDAYIQRRHEQDPDLWIVELDIVGGERFIGLNSPHN